MKILFTTPILEHPAAGGPQLRIENSIKALSRISDLYIVSRCPEHAIGGQDVFSYYQSICKDLYFAPSANGFSRNRYIRKLQRIARHFFVNDAQYLLSLVDTLGADVLWFGYGNISFDLIKQVKTLRPNLKVVCDTDSVWSRFVLRELPFESDPRRREKIAQDGAAKEREEREWVNLCDVTTAVSNVDAEYYKSFAMNPERIMLFSNAIDFDMYATRHSQPESPAQPYIYFAGSFGPKSPMDKAARWFINDIWPLIKREIPDLSLCIVGRGSKETLSDIQDQSIYIMGKMPTVLPFLQHASVAIVPLQFESGTRFKIMEAAACRIPIVSTTLGAEGIPVTHEEDVLIADVPEVFADSVLKLLTDSKLALSLAKKCYELIASNNSIHTISREGKNILDFLEFQSD